MSVLVFHSMVAPHVQQAALSFHETGKLGSFITTVCDEPASLRQRTLVQMARLFRLDLRQEFTRRAISLLPMELVETHPWAELCRVAVARLDRDRRLSDFLWETLEHRFDRMVARKLGAKFTGVYGYEHISLETFRHAQKIGMPIAYDVPSPETGFMRQTMEEEAGRHPELHTAYMRHTANREERRIARRREEWHCADRIIVGSSFTRQTYAKAGLDVTKVRIVPLGAPPPVDHDTARTGGTGNHAPLAILWAGSFSLNKGAHYLLEAWQQANLGSHARLEVYGHVALPEKSLPTVSAGIRFHGPVSRNELMDIYHASDVLIFPTLGDGFGMVATEAWSRGLPVITTEAAGASDFLRHAQNGLLIKSRDAAAIAGALEWCIHHRAELRSMRAAARETAAKWQWADYRSALREATSDLFQC